MTMKTLAKAVVAAAGIGVAALGTATIAHANSFDDWLQAKREGHAFWLDYASREGIPVPSGLNGTYVENVCENEYFKRHPSGAEVGAFVSAGCLETELGRYDSELPR